MAFGGQLQGLAVANSRMEHEFCRLVVAFDQGEAIGWYRGLKSTAHFLAWACEMTPSVAREHVRVARALQRMPVTDAAFADGRLSYSKVREITRLLRECDEAALAHLAEEMTASQLARTVSSYRTCAGTRLAAEGKRKFTIAPRGDGMVHLTVCLPAEDAAPSAPRSKPPLTAASPLARAPKTFPRERLPASIKCRRWSTLPPATSTPSPASPRTTTRSSWCT